MLKATSVLVWCLRVICFFGVSFYPNSRVYVGSCWVTRSNRLLFMTVECGWDWSVGRVNVTRLRLGMTLTGSHVLVMEFSNVTLTVMVHNCRHNNNNINKYGLRTVLN
jgi:hypothetical protein